MAYSRVGFGHFVIQYISNTLYLVIDFIYSTPSIGFIGLSRRNRVNVRTGLGFRDLEDLNDQAGKWLTETANTRIHGTQSFMGKYAYVCIGY